MKVFEKIPTSWLLAGAALACVVLWNAPSEHLLAREAISKTVIRHRVAPAADPSVVPHTGIEATGKGGSEKAGPV